MVVAGDVTAAIHFIYAIITVLRHAGDVTKIYLICFAVSVVLPVILINLLGLMGAVVSYLAIMALLLVLLIVEYPHIRQRIERARNRYALNQPPPVTGICDGITPAGSRCGQYASHKTK